MTREKCFLILLLNESAALDASYQASSRVCYAFFVWVVPPSFQQVAIWHLPSAVMSASLRNGSRREQVICCCSYRPGARHSIITAKKNRGKGGHELTMASETNWR